jgi:homoserine dehydrogenase
MASPLKIGIAGLGTVGASVVRLIDGQHDALVARCGRPIEVVAVSARSRGKKRDLGRKSPRWVADPVTLATDPEIDVFVELMGGEGDPAKAAVSAALAAKKSVVTANKALREGLAGNSLARIYGILNGTCNYILTRMEQEKLAFADCLKEAQRLGYAEADPTFDIEGHDTAQKLAILASLAFGTKVDQSAVYVEGISSIASEDLEWADELGYRVKLLGVAVRTDKGIEQRVHPTMVPKDTAIAQVMGVTNAVTVDADAITPITLVGPGAGGMATASSVVSDIGDIARGVRTAPFGRPTGRLTVSKKAPMQRHEGGYYIRLLAVDKPGTAATIAKRLAQQNISLESIVQRHRGERPHGGDVPGRSSEPVPVILITYATTEDAVRKALAAVDRDKVVLGKPQVIRIEKN